MKRWLVTIAVLWPAGCSSGEINRSCYQLPVVQSSIQSIASQNNHLLWAEQVAIPNYLAGSGVVYQTNDVKYVIANNSLWASPLDRQLCNTLVTSLSTQLPDWVVASQPLGDAQDTFNATATESSSHYDGKVIASGEWLSNYQGQLTKRLFCLEGIQAQNGYDKMVKVLASVWSQEAASIAQGMKRLP